MHYSLDLYVVLTVVNNLECKLRINCSVAESNPVMKVKKPVEGKENKLDARGAVPNRRSIKRFRSPGLDDASPGKYSQFLSTVKGSKEVSVVSDGGLLRFCRCEHYKSLVLCLVT
jgi:hypothetical protein